MIISNIEKKIKYHYFLFVFFCSIISNHYQSYSLNFDTQFLCTLKWISSFFRKILISFYSCGCAVHVVVWNVQSWLLTLLFLFIKLLHHICPCISFQSRLQQNQFLLSSIISKDLLEFSVNLFIKGLINTLPYSQMSHRSVD